MATSLFDRVKMSVSGTPGTGTITLGARVTDAINGDSLSFADAGVPNAATVSYVVIDGHNWAKGKGTYTSSGTTLSRDAAETFWDGSSLTSTGPKALTSAAIVFITALAADIPVKDAANTWAAAQTFSANLNFNGTLLTFSGLTSAFPALKRNGTALEARLADDSTTTNINAAGFQVDPAGWLFWNGRSHLVSPADGTITLQNNASSGFGLLQFGGTTSSFPALKRNSAALDLRLADDSAYAGLNTGAATHTAAGAMDLKVANLAETATVSATAATGTINYDVDTQSVLYYTSNASANWTLNVRGSSTVSLNTLMAVNDVVTIAFLVTQGATAYYESAFQIDGSAVTPKWQGGSAPAAGDASSIDVYTYTIIKTGSAAFTVLASITKFA